MNVESMDNDSRTSTGYSDDVNTDFDARTQSGAGRSGSAADQLPARSEVEAATESDTGTRSVPSMVSGALLVRAAHCAAVRFQRKPKGSSGSVSGATAAVRTSKPVPS